MRGTRTVKRTISKFNLFPSQEGDRVIAVDGQSLESLGYTAALDILRGAGQQIELLVSQLR